MAGRVQQDTFMDDDDDSCPLCVEEFDLSDKNFRPCPCGYQVCQFCFNNIKNNMNGLCPACRRVYDDKTIQWKVVSPEDMKADIQLQARKKAAARQKEADRKQVETLNRKHLAGLRVVQKNLVYVVGLSPKSREEDLLQTLRGDQYFGQYGKIIKIVVSKAKEGSNGNSIGVYVTFANKQDAASCIAAVDGSQNGDRILKAQYGTTKYCSAFLRNETCNKRSCMFLHETGEDNDSFSRQDLSSMNAVSIQRPAPPLAPSSRPSQVSPQPQPPAQQAPIAVASQSIAASAHKDEAMSRSDSGDGSALPSTASWAAKNPQIEGSRQSSKAASTSSPSPLVTVAIPAEGGVESQKAPSEPVPALPPPGPTTEQTTTSMKRLTRERNDPLDDILRRLMDPAFRFTFDRSMYSAQELKEIDAYPPLFDPNGGLVRYRMEQERDRERLKREDEERNILGAISAAEEDENPASGSLQLGGEPETRDGTNEVTGRIGGNQLPYPTTASQPFGSSSFPGPQHNNMSLNGTGILDQQQQHNALFNPNENSSYSSNQFQPSYTGPSSHHQHQPSNPFNVQSNQFSNHGHGRQVSRFTFANDTASASAAVKPAANAQIMAQQSAMMPTNQSRHVQNQQAPQSTFQHNPHFYSGVQGPPPGLKSSGTPPISGGGMFGQGHGFASAMGGSIGIGSGSGAVKNSNEELMRSVYRSRSGVGNGQGNDVGKREFIFPSILHQTIISNPSSAPSPQNLLYNPQLGTLQGLHEQGLHQQKRKGKKHRHANTSSFGGGGIVDLADPSILQARMHRAGAGQGLSGVQVPPIIPPLMLPAGRLDPTAEEDIKVGSGRPQDGKATSGSKMSTASDSLPGLSRPENFPPLVAPQSSELTRGRPNATSTQAATKATVPVNETLQVRPATSKDVIKASGSPLGAAASPNLPDQSTESATISPSEKPYALTPSQHVAGSISPMADPVVHETPSSQNIQPSSLQPTETKKKDVQEMTARKVEMPGNLDIAATKRDTQDATDKVMALSKSNKAETPAKKPQGGMSTVLGASQPATPITASSVVSSSSTARQIQPRTSRVLPSSKIETPSRVSASSPLVSHAEKSPSLWQEPSRQPSLASINRPATPASEKISDNASIASTALSRANSPGPGRIGSAPLRQTTKSQQKKERQAKARLAEEAVKAGETSVKAVTEEPVQAPIIGRKKKAKKTTGVTDEATPSDSRVPSPGPMLRDHDIPASDQFAISEPGKSPGTAAEKGHKHEETLSKDDETVQELGEERQSKASLTAAAIYAELQKARQISSSVPDLFRNVPGLNYRFDINQNDLRGPENDSLPVLSKEQMHQLDCNEPITVDTAQGKRVIILPNQRILKNLNNQQIDRYLELRKESLKTPVMFSRQQKDIDDYLPKAILSAVETEDGRKTTVPYSPSEDTTDFMRDVFAMRKHQSVPFNTDFPGSGVTAPTDEHSSTHEPILSVEEAEKRMIASRKETEGIEKRLNALIKKNGRLLFGRGH